MSVADPHVARTPAAPAIGRWAWPALIVFLVAVYAVGYDQGALLQPLLGAASRSMNYMHELMHDGRHLLGFPCH
ncbi:MAG TPA: CbtB-domain containing protein [Candidatus Dormibacteraeota bacterium]